MLDMVPTRHSGPVSERIAILETVVDHLVTLVETTDTRLDRLERIIWQAVGALGLVVMLANIVGPIVLRGIGVVP